VSQRIARPYRERINLTNSRHEKVLRLRFLDTATASAAFTAAFAAGKTGHARRAAKDAGARSRKRSRLNRRPLERA
jgi:hypothetical protein